MYLKKMSNILPMSNVIQIAVPSMFTKETEYTVGVDLSKVERRWVFAHPSGGKTVKSSMRKESEYGFKGVLYYDLDAGQTCKVSPLANAKGGAGTKFASFTLALEFVVDNYDLIDAINTCYNKGTCIQFVVVDQVDGGNRSSLSIGVSGSIVVVKQTADYYLVRMVANLHGQVFRPFSDDKDIKYLGNLAGTGINTVNQSSDISKTELKHLLDEASKAMSKGLSGK